MIVRATPDLHNQARFLDGRTLVVTEERAEESPARRCYGAPKVLSR